MTYIRKKPFEEFFKLFKVNHKRLALISWLIPFFIFLPSLFFDFSYDDFHQIHFHDFLKTNEISIESVLFPFFEATFPGDVYRPLTVFSYRINFLLFGLNPLSYHLFNILLLATVTCLVFLLVREICKNLTLSFLASLWFAINPLRVEVVASIVGRAELLSALFGISS
ncbi:MAG: hypothetical protein KDD56_01730, partial [Bdellovibrionales bacterium]|nr:hypothetical protein [Bdellovibrionales bacterium]